MKTQTDRVITWRIAGLLALSVVPVVAGMARLGELAGGVPRTPADTRFFVSPVPVVLHILAATLFSVLGAFQFVPQLRRRSSGWHRRMGVVLNLSGFVVALTGLWMAHNYPWPEGDGVVLYVERLIFGALMLVSLLMSWVAIGRRKYLEHGAWMTRAYAIAMGAGTQVLTHLPLFILGVKLDEPNRAVAMGLAWVINLAFAEWVIRGHQGLLELKAPRLSA